VRLISLGVIGAVGLMLMAGTVVTGTGPLAGARSVPRYPLPLAAVTQLHADIGWLLGGLVVALLLGLRLGGAPRRAVRLGWLLAGLFAAQGAVGYAQYFSGLPAGLVWVHELGATSIFTVLTRKAYFNRSPATILRSRSLSPTSRWTARFPSTFTTTQAFVARKYGLTTRM